MTNEERKDIYKAINNVSKKVNDISQKLDEVIHMLNKQTNERIEISNKGIDDIVDMVVAHNEAIDGLAEMITESEEQ